MNSCSPPPPTEADDSLPAQRETLANSTPGPQKQDEKRMRFIRLLVGTIEAPLGTLSESEEVWSYLDEQSVRSLGSAAPGANGIRIGIGKEAIWQDLASVLEQETGQAVQRSRCVLLPGQTAPLVMQRDRDSQTVFIAHKDGMISGNLYPVGDRLLTVGISLVENDPSRIILTALPQIRSAMRRTEIIKQSGRYTMVDKPATYELDSLAFQAPMSANSFVVVGPNPQARRTTSAGYGLFLHKRDGLLVERLFVLRPEVLTRPSP